MIDTVMSSVAIPYRETRFQRPPTETYAVWTDNVSASGSDAENMILTHGYTIELYEYKPDAAAESSIESALDEAGLRWTKQPRYWLQIEQLYQVIYEFEFIEIRR